MGATPKSVPPKAEAVGKRPPPPFDPELAAKQIAAIKEAKGSPPKMISNEEKARAAVSRIARDEEAPVAQKKPPLRRAGSLDARPAKGPPPLLAATPKGPAGGGGDAPPQDSPRRGRSLTQRTIQFQPPERSVDTGRPRSSSRQTVRDRSESETSCRDGATGIRVKDKDELLVRGMIRTTRHRAVQYQMTVTRGGWGTLERCESKANERIFAKIRFSQRSKLCDA